MTGWRHLETSRRNEPMNHDTTFTLKNSDRSFSTGSRYVACCGQTVQSMDAALKPKYCSNVQIGWPSSSPEAMAVRQDSHHDSPPRTQSPVPLGESTDLSVATGPAYSSGHQIAGLWDPS
jgi:hypothetical protein